MFSFLNNKMLFRVENCAFEFTILWNAFCNVVECTKMSLLKAHTSATESNNIQF